METQFLLDWFKYYMPMEQRQKLMLAHPMLYNKLVGSEIMITGRKCDNEIKELAQ